jgi:hypothetical protein
MHWDEFAVFWETVYVPYFIGALGPGIVLSLGFYYLTIPLVEAYQKAQAQKAEARSEKRSEWRGKLAALKARAEAAAEGLQGERAERAAERGQDRTGADPAGGETSRAAPGHGKGEDA